MTYSRLKDTSYLPRRANKLDRTSEDGDEVVHRIDDPDAKRISLKKILGAIRKNNRSVSGIDSRRLDSINNLDNLTKLRQIIRNRKAQIHHKIIHSEGLEEAKRSNPDEGTSKDMSWVRKGAPKPVKPSRRLPDAKGLRTYATSDKRQSVEVSLSKLERQKEKQQEDPTTPRLDNRNETRKRPHELVPFTVQYTGPDKLPPKGKGK